MTNKLIHVGTIREKNEGKRTLFLRECAPKEYLWFAETVDGTEEPTGLVSETIEDSLRIAHKHWRHSQFQGLRCGFRYTLPERDEHGMNALFFQMAASLSAFNGIYFDQELGHNCFVQNASQDAVDLWHKLRKENRL